jgi:hypothetical protein
MFQFWFPSAGPQIYSFCDISSKSFPERQFAFYGIKKKGVIERKDYCLRTEF